MMRPDPRVALRQQTPDADGVADLRRRLERLDAASPWTLLTLRLIRDNPGLRAPPACAAWPAGNGTAGVRKLKRLGLTESRA